MSSNVKDGVFFLAMATLIGVIVLAGSGKDWLSTLALGSLVTACYAWVEGSQG